MGCGGPGCPPQGARSLSKPTSGLGSAPWSCRTQEAPWTKAQGGVPAEARTLGLFRPSTTPAHSRHLCWSWKFPSQNRTWWPHLIYSLYLFLLCSTKDLRQRLAKNVMTDGGDRSTVFTGCSLFKIRSRSVLLLFLNRPERPLEMQPVVSLQVVET